MEELSLPLERWLPVVGYEGLYEVSSLGRVWSVPGRRREGRILALCMASAAAQTLNMSMPGHGKKTRLVHRLVLEAFVGPCPPEMECRHLDGDPHNNRLENLAWGTSAENKADRARHGTDNAGDRHPMAKLCAADIPSIRELLAERVPQARIAALFGVTRSAIQQILLGNNWRSVE